MAATAAIAAVREHARAVAESPAEANQLLPLREVLRGDAFKGVDATRQPAAAKQVQLAAVEATQRCVCRLYREDAVALGAKPKRKGKRKAGSDALQAYQEWLREQAAAISQELLGLVAAGDLEVAGAAVEAYVRVHAAQESARLRSQAKGRAQQHGAGASSTGLEAAVLRGAVEAVLARDDPAKLAGGKRTPAQVLVQTFVNGYADLRLGFLEACKVAADELRDPETSVLVRAARKSGPRAEAAEKVARNLVRMMPDVVVALDRKALRQLLVGTDAAGEAMDEGDQEEEEESESERDAGGQSDDEDSDDEAGRIDGGRVRAAKVETTGDATVLGAPLARLTPKRRKALHRRALQEAWVSVLHVEACRGGLQRRLLEHLPTEVLPHVASPLPFVDPLLALFGSGGGGEVSILALNSLFRLMTEHGVDCPQYFRSLYQLLQPEASGDGVPAGALLQSRHRHAFLRLLANSVATRTAPAYLVAAFLKRLARGALSAAPHAALFASALSVNALHQHPELIGLIHREPEASADQVRGTQASAARSGKKRKRRAAAYDADAADPKDAHADGAQLWELAALEQHYLHSVADLVTMLQRPFKKTDVRLKVTKEYARTTYGSLFLYEISSHEKGLEAPGDGILVGDTVDRVQGPKRKRGGRRSKNVVDANREVPLSTHKPGPLFPEAAAAAGTDDGSCVGASFGL